MSTGRTIVITGATDGLGLAVARELAAASGSASLPDRLVLHGRDRTRLDRISWELRQRHSVRVVPIIADLAGLDQVRQLAEDLAEAVDEVDVLVNNAGVGFGPPGAPRQLSADRHELRLAINYLAPFSLTLRAMPLLRAARRARVVLISSIGQHPIDFDDLMMEREYDGVTAYRRSKLALTTFGFALARRLEGEPTTVNSVHPATLMPTKMLFEHQGNPMSTLETGVASALRMINDPSLDTVSGKFFNEEFEARAKDQAYSPEAQAKLWQAGMALTGAPNMF